MSFHGIRFVPAQPRVPFVRMRHWAFAVSLLLSLATLGSLLVQGLNLGIDFKGGTLIELATVEPIDIGSLREQVGALELGEVNIQTFGAPNIALIRIQAQQSEEATQAAIRKVRGSLGESYEYRRVEQVGPTVGAELLRDGLIATVLAILGIAAYVYFRFEWQFAVSSLIATTHDVFITVGLFSLLQLEFGLTAIAALLTLAGYSINDTVVVFDRMREVLRKHKSMPLTEVIDLSVNQTLSRTILTSGTTLLAILPLLIYGGSALFTFTLAMAWGLVIGTFSSVFVAASIMLYMPPVGQSEGRAERPAEAPL